MLTSIEKNITLYIAEPIVPNISQLTDAREGKLLKLVEACLVQEASQDKGPSIQQFTTDQSFNVPSCSRDQSEDPL